MGWRWNTNRVVGGGWAGGRDEVGIQMGWLGSRGKETGRDTNRVAVVARGVGGRGVGLQIGWWGPAGEG